MPADQLKITIMQTSLVWEDRDANLSYFTNCLASLTVQPEIVVLPEMFTTGFSMQAEKLAETMDGPSVKWMQSMASKHRCIITGSLMIEENGNYFNRLVWMQPDGNYGYYDKRHLFGYAGEDKHFTAGEKKLLLSVKGWRISPLICYDLRFPVWSRNAPEHYDVLLYVANWPERRSTAWKTLLQARAIENQSFVVGVNRVGTDGNGMNYSGDSSVFGPLGETIWQQSNDMAIYTCTLEMAQLEEARTNLPFLKDADKFRIF